VRLELTGLVPGEHLQLNLARFLFIAEVWLEVQDLHEQVFLEYISECERQFLSLRQDHMASSIIDLRTINLKQIVSCKDLRYFVVYLDLAADFMTGQVLVDLESGLAEQFLVNQNNFQFTGLHASFAIHAPFTFVWIWLVNCFLLMGSHGRYPYDVFFYAWDLLDYGLFSDVLDHIFKTASFLNFSGI